MRAKFSVKFGVKFVAVLAPRLVFCEISRGFKEASNFTERVRKFEPKFTALFTARAAQIWLADVEEFKPEFTGPFCLSAAQIRPPLKGKFARVSPKTASKRREKAARFIALAPCRQTRLASLTRRFCGRPRSSLARRLRR